MSIIAKYSDYAVQSVEYFIDAIESGLALRDLPGITAFTTLDGEKRSRIEIIPVLKQHPLVSLMANQLSEIKNADALRSSLVPSIGVTPGNLPEDGVTLGQGYKSETVDDDFIDELRVFLTKTSKEKLQDLLITDDQINDIISAYRKTTAGSVLCQVHQWMKAEEINVSVWSTTADDDILLSNLLDSILADIVVGFAGDNSPLKKMSYRVTRGLTNFNFGRVLFGTEFSLTFTNTYNNYTIYSEERISSVELDATFTTAGEE